MNGAALLVLADWRFIERQIGTLFCGQSVRRLREQCLRGWRRCGC